MKPSCANREVLLPLFHKAISSTSVCTREVLLPLTLTEMPDRKALTNGIPLLTKHKVNHQMLTEKWPKQTRVISKALASRSSLSGWILHPRGSCPNGLYSVSNDSRKKKKKGKKSTSKPNQVVYEVPSLMNDVLGEHYDIAAEVDHKKLGEEPGTASATLQDERATSLLEVSTKEKQFDIIPGADNVNVVSNEKNTNENASLDGLTAKPTDDVHVVSNDAGKKKKKGKKSKSKLNQIVSEVPSLGNDVLGEHYGITAEVDHKNLGEEPSSASAPLQGECVITPLEVCPKEKQSGIIPGADEIHVVSNDKNKNENASVDGLTAKTTDDVHVVSNETGKKKKKGKKSKSKLNQVVSGVTSSGNDVLGEHYDITAEVDHKNFGEEPGTASAPLQGITPPVISTKEKQFDIVPGAEKHAIPVLDVENKSKASVEEAPSAADKMRNSKSRCPADAKGNVSLAVGEPFDQQMDVRESGHKNSALSWGGGAAEENTASKKSTFKGLLEVQTLI
ncbi:uncharacterized protein LOC133825296 [Humulus lupulus]|uniref:uncharacterized protein LOC133825296 n=1 Tax=Humulus lupulus TaxID=3486 RepID=UPI002B4124E3|nr:uncharacterized protein LOC133825296 [Humulus lupulus]